MIKNLENIDLEKKRKIKNTLIINIINLKNIYKNNLYLKLR